MWGSRPQSPPPLHSRLDSRAPFLCHCVYCTRSEVSLNVALHTTPDLRGSRVGFEPGFRGASGASGASEVLWVGHSIGTAFINLCQQVSWQRRATRIRGHPAPRRL